MLINQETLLTIRQQLRICHEKASELLFVSDPYIQMVMSEEFDEHLDDLMDIIEGDYLHDA